MSTQTIESRSPQDQSDVVVSAPAADREVVAAAFKRAREAQREWSRSALARADALSAAAEALAAAQGRCRRADGARGRQAADRVGDGARPRGAHPALPGAVGDGPRRRHLSGRAARGSAHAAVQPPPPARRRGPDHALELPVRDPAVEGGAGAGLRQHRGAEAGLGRDRLRAAAGRRSSASTCPRASSTSSPGRAPRARPLVELADVVSFTGSTAVGLGVAAAATARGIASQAEMGGLNASIVLPDADVEAAAKVIAGAAMGYAGQKCTATGPRDRARRPGAVHRCAGRRGRGAADRRSRRRRDRRRPGDQPAGARRAGRRRARPRPATAAGS